MSKSTRSCFVLFLLFWSWISTKNAFLCNLNRIGQFNVTSIFSNHQWPPWPRSRGNLESWMVRTRLHVTRIRFRVDVRWQAFVSCANLTKKTTYTFGKRRDKLWFSRYIQVVSIGCYFQCSLFQLIVLNHIKHIPDSFPGSHFLPSTNEVKFCCFVYAMEEIP